METEFNSDENNFAYPDGIENTYWNKARNKIIFKTINKYPLLNVLDVGCGRGIVTGYLLKKGIQIEGIELGNTTPISNSKIPVKYNTNALSLPEELSNLYNTISLFDVIEHIENPEKFLHDLVSHFNNVEFLIITVPAHNELWTNFDEYYGHFKRYELSTIENELQKIGFDIIVNKYFFHTLYLLIKISNRFFKKREIQFNVPGRFLTLFNNVISQLFYWESILVPQKFYGSSIICIAKKSKK